MLLPAHSRPEIFAPAYSIPSAIVRHFSELRIVGTKYVKYGDVGLTAAQLLTDKLLQQIAIHNIEV